jgi:hypothetical protein
VIDVAYVTYSQDADLPRFDVDLDLPVAVDAFADAGLTWEVVAWDDHGFDWSSVALVVVRSPWDYVPRRRQFLAWAHDVASLTRLENPYDVLEHNTDKSYLRELSDRGVHTVPTGWVATAHEAESVVASVRGVHGPWLVVKPTISAGARDTIRTDDADTAVAHARAVVATGRVAMVQPYLDAVDEEGETSVLVVDGRLTHAVRKVPALTEGGGGDASGLVELTPELRDATTTVLTTAGATDLLYARVDLVRDASGELALMELELAEPSLFLDLAPHAAVALAAGVAARLR